MPMSLNTVVLCRLFRSIVSNRNLVFGVCEMDQWRTETSQRAALHASKLAVAAAQAALAKSDEAICAADQLCAELLDWAQTGDAPLRVRGSRRGSASLRVPMCPEWLDQTPDRAADQLHGELLDWATPVRTSSDGGNARYARCSGSAMAQPGLGSTTSPALATLP